MNSSDCINCPHTLGSISNHMWNRPPENSLLALKHGMDFSDGVEFDLRMDADGELVIYHDEALPTHGTLSSRCIENMHTSKLKEEGVLTFQEIIDDREFLQKWQSGCKTVDIEIKMPHPVVGKSHNEYLQSIMKKITIMTQDLLLTPRSTIVSSFSPGIAKASAECNFGIPVTQLVPKIRPWGRHWRVKKMFAIPQFFMTSVPSIAKKFRDDGMNSVGMALEYVSGWERHARLGRVVGLKGEGLVRLHQSLRGMGAFVWPGPLHLEAQLLDAGISIVTDHMNPDVITKPDGTYRWPRPASQPLDEEWSRRLSDSSPADLGDLMVEARSSLPIWTEMDEDRKSRIILEQGRRMNWEGSENSWLSDLENGIPWGSPRIIGHRGAGKTLRK